jgi:hypothetical protein
MTQEALKLALEKIATVNAMDYEYQAWAREALRENAMREVQRLGQEIEQEPVVGTKTWFEDGEVVTQNLTASEIYKEPDEEEYLAKAYRMANELRCHLAIAPAPQRTWVGLTGDDWKQITRKANYHWEMTTSEYAERIGELTESKLKEKNT